MPINKPLVIPISKIERENETMRSYYFKYSLNSKPGQFVMLWIPGIDEKPIAIAQDRGDSFFVTVAAVGFATKKLAQFKLGDKLGIRGPYGSSFKFNKNQHLVLVGGGYGTATLFAILDKAARLNCTIDFLVGAREKKQFILLQKIKSYTNLKLQLSTNDGSAGFKGTVTELLEKMIRRKSSKIDAIFSCGPELMMKKISDMAYKSHIPAQFSIERYMKCGFGICGNCALDPEGVLVCRKGTIFSNEKVRKFNDFGIYHRDAEGKKHFFERTRG